MKQDKSLFRTVNYAEIGQQIDPDLAAKMVKDFNDAHPDLEKTFTIGKSIIEQILAQPGCVALQVYPAINEYGRPTLVYCGLDEKGDIITKYPIVREDGQIYMVDGVIGDRSSLSWFS